MLVRLLLNTPIWAKAFAASVVLLLCLVGLGTTAYLTLDKSARGLKQLRGANLPKQNAVSGLTHDVIATHVKLFRHVTWGSNGVSPTLLKSLSADIVADLTAMKDRFHSLGSQQSLSPAERENWLALSTNWEKYDRAARDTLDVAATDAPMATMMLGATDDDFQQVATELQSLSALVSDRTGSVTGALADEAESKKWILALGGFAGVLISVLVTLFVAGSIVAPIRSVTQAMSQISTGNTDVDLGCGDRKDEIGQMINAIAVFRHNLQLQKEELHTQNLRFDAALNNMPQGVCLVDSAERLVVCNDRYARMYGLSSEQVKPGTMVRDILAHRVANGFYVGADPEAYIRELLAFAQGRSACDHNPSTQRWTRHFHCHSTDARRGLGRHT